MNLAKYLRESGERDGDFAKRARISIHALRKYKSKQRMPRPSNLLKIKKATGGIVNEADWYK